MDHAKCTDGAADSAGTGNMHNSITLDFWHITQYKNVDTQD